jgi:natural product biosynthesis luciferase-like monooxygenase protein
MSNSSTPSCFILGEGSLIVQCALTLRERGLEIRGIVTREPAVRQWADGEGVRVIKPGNGAADAMRAEPFDYLFSIVNLEILPDEIVTLPRRLAVNFHDGPLPKYAGINTPSWALLEQATEYGVTWHEMTAGADRGRILAQETFELAPDETAFSLNTRCFGAGMNSFVSVVDGLLSDALELREQDFSRRTYFRKFQRPEAASLIDFGQGADEIRAFVAAHDYGPGFPNPFGLPKVLLGERVLYVRQAEATAEPSAEAPGTLITVDARGLLVATGDRNVSLSGLTCPLGSEPDAAVLAEWGFAAGKRLDGGPREALTRFTSTAAPAEPRWLAALRSSSPVVVGSGTDAGEAGLKSAELPLSGGRDAGATAAAFAAFLGRTSGQDSISFGLEGRAIEDAAAEIRPFVYSRVPVTCSVRPADSVASALEGLEGDIRAAVEDGPLPRDLFLRHPELQATPRDGSGPTFPVVIRLGGDAPAAPGDGVALEVVVADDGRSMTWRHDAGTVSTAEIASLQHQFTTFLSGLEGADTLGAVPLIDDDDRRLLLDEWNGPVASFPGDATVHGLLSAQAAATPDAPALSFRGETLTYQEVDERTNRLARHLNENGVGTGSLVGVFMDRSAEMVMAALAVMKAGGAYLPLDPQYPADRIAFMIEDSGAKAILTEERLRARLPENDALLVSIDGDAGAIARHDAAAPDAGATSSDLAYVIYTSGSTGRPKGVMVEHRNVVSFFTGMDDRLGHAPGADAPGTWLAVTSLNFDISVLELFWTLTRGFEVVVFAEDRAAGSAGGAASGMASTTGSGSGADSAAGADWTPAHAGRRIDFGAFYFSSDEGEGLRDKYQLLIEGAKFADRNGFNSVWTPERHFHAFGGLFPNPAVTSAALATITENVQLRAGSCVSPLHSPIRIAEDWAVVDNLSRGRVGISFAAGWQPNDFVIRPEAFKDRRDRMFRDIETVKALWRGESRTFPDADGKDIEIRTLPRPYSDELEVWVTAAGNPETFRDAGTRGANLLTHLLGQTTEELKEKIAIYRQARADAGHEGRGTVSLMLHTYVAETDDEAKEVVREPMKAYLRSAVGLVKAAAWSFPTFKKTTTMEDGTFGIDHLSEEDMDALLNYSFERYYDAAGLFGSVESCVRFVDSIKGADVDEIPCLIDFGMTTPVVLEALPRLAEVLHRANADVKEGAEAVAKEGATAANGAASPSPDAPAGATSADHSIPALIARHGVTHFQCTPSQASLLLADAEVRDALAGLKKVMIGGEAFPAPMARELESLVQGDVINMYGPTETTIWSTTHPVRDIGEAVPIGRPIANARVVLLDRNGGLVPPGAVGELCIGGPGVVRGYLHRPDLTAERFIPDPFSDDADARLYRTGDLARFRPDGVLEFHGRLDQQVKLRGYRIELGEIEALLAEHPDVGGAAVIVREDVPGDQRIVAYVLAGASSPRVEELRSHLAGALPDYMVPSAFVTLDRFPETPNRKIDRKALPAPESGARRPSTPFVQPSSQVESTIAAIWCEVLGVEQVGSDDNFFDLGGHSLLTIQVQGKLKEAFDQPVSLVDLFRYTTVGSLAAFLDGGNDQEEMQRSADRGADRREALARRQAARGKRR